MTRELRIADRLIRDESDCFVIAEVGHNHQGDVEKCKELFRRAKEAGCDSVKIQKRDNRRLYTKEYYDRPYDNENSFGPTYGAHREFLEFGRKEYVELKQCADSLGLVFFATAFDFPSADFLAELDVPAFKLASGDITDTPLLRYVAKLGKPMIVSTGTATMDDVRRAHDTIREVNPNVALLQCTANYPNQFEELDLGVVRTYRETFPDTVVGVSMHDSGIAMAVAAYVLGARILEKHFTLNRAMKGTDHAFSLEPAGMTKMVRDLRRTRLAIGDGRKKIHPSEEGARKKMGKSLYAARALPAGTVLRSEDVAIKSPGGHLPPYELDRILGARLVKPLRDEEPITLAHLDGLRK